MSTGLEKKVNINEVQKEWISEWIDTFLKSQYVFQHTDFILVQDKFSFIIKAKDLLRPSITLIGNSYSFNKYNIVNANINNIVYTTSKENMFRILKEAIVKKEYYKFCHRIESYTPPKEDF